MSENIKGVIQQNRCLNKGGLTAKETASSGDVDREQLVLEIHQVNKEVIGDTQLRGGRFR